MAKVLVIDDELGILDLLDDVLHQKGHEVVLAVNGQAGLQLFQQARPHVTILDFKMPDMGGLAVLREIRTLDPNALVIMLTGFGTEEREDQARQLGAADFLDKHLALHALGPTLDRVMAQVGKSMMIGEQRRFPRFLIQFPVTFIRDGVMIGEGTGLDLSVEGCAVVNQADLRIGDHLELRLHLLDCEEPSLPLTVEIAAVRWTIQKICGLEFISLPSEDKTRLRRHVDTLEPTRS